MLNESLKVGNISSILACLATLVLRCHKRLNALECGQCMFITATSQLQDKRSSAGLKSVLRASASQSLFSRQVHTPNHSGSRSTNYHSCWGGHAQPSHSLFHLHYLLELPSSDLRPHLQLLIAQCYHHHPYHHPYEHQCILTTLHILPPQSLSNQVCLAAVRILLICSSCVEWRTRRMRLDRRPPLPGIHLQDRTGRC